MARGSLKLLIIVKTYPTVSGKYDELVCTAGICPHLGFVRLYPVPFRYLDYEKQYRKYQWIEVQAEKNPKDPRIESYRPQSETIKVIGKPMDTANGWAERRQVVLPWLSQSVEELTAGERSVGIIRPAEIRGMQVLPVARDWSPAARAKLSQGKLLGVHRKMLRKLPYKFQYLFRCDDNHCKGHRLMVADWELGSLYFKVVDESGGDEQAAVAKVEDKFLRELCGPKKDTCLFVGNTLTHPNSWLVLGVFFPPVAPQETLAFE